MSVILLHLLITYLFFSSFFFAILPISCIAHAPHNRLINSASYVIPISHLDGSIV